MTGWTPWLIGLYALAAITNLLLFAEGGDWDKLLIAGLFVAIAANTSTIETWKTRARGDRVR